MKRTFVLLDRLMKLAGMLIESLMMNIGLLVVVMPSALVTALIQAVAIREWLAESQVEWASEVSVAVAFFVVFAIESTNYSSFHFAWRHDNRGAFVLPALVVVFSISALVAIEFYVSSVKTEIVILGILFNLLASAAYYVRTGIRKNIEHRDSKKDERKDNLAAKVEIEKIKEQGRTERAKIKIEKSSTENSGSSLTAKQFIDF